MAFPAACRLADSTGTMETMLLHLHLVRHGQTFFNRYNRLQGWSNSPLTDAGLADADKAAAKADKAQAKIPKKQVRQKTVDPETGEVIFREQ